MTRRKFLLWLPTVPAILRELPNDVQFEGQEKLQSILSQARKEKWSKHRIGDLVAKVGQSLIGTPYVGWTLERDVDREFCYVTLTGLDCVTFFESALGIARMIKNGQSRPQDLVDQVTKTRYRKGRVGGYPSRLHYTSDWIDENDRRGAVRNITAKLPGALPLEKDFNFMSTKSDLYRQLKAHPELIREISATEAELTRISQGPKARLWYVPTSGVAAIESRLQTGDIVGIVTSIPGMDCSHTGLIQKQGPHARFLHASSSAKKVTLGPRISEYLKANPKSTGLMVARPI